MPKLSTNVKLAASKRRVTIEIISALLILLFVYAGASKLMEFRRFTQQLHESPLIENYSRFIAVVLPVVEFIISLLLFIPASRLTGLYASFILMSAFAAYLAYMIIFVPGLPCSCGGVLRHMSWKQHLVFNIFFTLLALMGIILKRNKRFIAINRVSPKPV